MHRGILGIQGPVVPLHDGNPSCLRLQLLRESIVSIVLIGCTNLTASTSGVLVILFSRIPIIGLGVLGVLSKIALTASTPCIVANILSNAQGTPPRCVCPNVVIRVSRPSFLESKFLRCSGVIGSRFESIAPSATITIVLRFPVFRPYDQFKWSN